MQDYVEVTKQGLNPGLCVFYAGASGLPLHKENYEITDGIFKYNRITETWPKHNCHISHSTECR